MSARALVAGLAAALLAALVPAVPAAAAVLPARTTPPAPAHEDELLVVTADDLDLVSLSPGATVRWQVGAHLSGAPWGRLAVELYADGDLVLAEPGLLVRVDSCDVRWSVPDGGPAGCAGTEQALFDEHRVVAEAGTALIDVGMLTPEDSHWLLVQITLPESTPDSSQRLGARLGIGLTAAGEERSPTPPPPGPTAGPTGRPTTGPTAGPTARPSAGPPAGPTIGPTAAPPVVGIAPGPDRTATPGTGSDPGPARAAAPGTRSLSGVLALTGSDPLAALALGAASVLAGLLLSGLARLVRPGRR